MVDVVYKKISNLLFTSKPAAVPDYPSFVLMEVTNACNLRCRMCPIYGEGVTRKRETGFIRKDIWQRAIDEIGSWLGQIALDLHGPVSLSCIPSFSTSSLMQRPKRTCRLNFFPMLHSWAGKRQLPSSKQGLTGSVSLLAELSRNFLNSTARELY